MFTLILNLPGGLTRIMKCRNLSNEFIIFNPNTQTSSNKFWIQSKMSKLKILGAQIIFCMTLACDAKLIADLYRRNLKSVVMTILEIILQLTTILPLIKGASR